MLEAVAFLSLILAAAAGFVAWQARQQLAALQAQLQEVQTRQSMQQQSISGLTAGAVGMDRRLRRAEASSKVLNERQETIENQAASEQPYGQAIRMVQQGASVERLIDELQLSESEADLIVRLHGLRDSA